MMSRPPVERIAKEQSVRLQLAELSTCSPRGGGATQPCSKTPTKIQAQYSLLEPYFSSLLYSFSKEQLSQKYSLNHFLTQ